MKFNWKQKIFLLVFTVPCVSLLLIFAALYHMGFKKVAEDGISKVESFIEWADGVTE